MEPSPIRLRRVRRADSAAVGALLAAAGAGTLPLDRATLRRFRRLVADLGADCYLAERDGALVGLVHVTYTRHFFEGQRATLALLVVDPDARRQGIGQALTDLALRRARRRGCRVLTCYSAEREAAAAWLRRLGWRDAGGQLQVDLTPRAG
jgi:ribosomal protein S18 acetylase RimI-like enzyme